jgi:hypothetical protein
MYSLYMLFNTRNVHVLNIRTFLLAWRSGVELRPDSTTEKSIISRQQTCRHRLPPKMQAFK